MDILKWINENIIWGAPMIFIMLGTGVFFTVKLRFFQFRRLGFIMKSTLFSKKKDDGGKALSPFQTLTASLATTLGTGNIVAIGSAIVLGGAGAVFWMWVSAFLGMATSYAENYLGMKYRSKNPDGTYTGGAFYYIRNGLGSGKLAAAFGFFCILASVGMGNMAQMNAMSSSLRYSFGCPEPLSGIIAAVCVGAMVFGGLKRLGVITERLIPVISAIYILGCLWVIFANFAKIPDMFLQIFKGAFDFRAMGGGFFGSAMAKSMSWGFRRGIFSNEAGLGSSVMLHSASSETNPQNQSLWATMQVFIDTIVMCSLTAFAVILTGADKAGADGMKTAIIAFESAFGDFAGAFVSVCIFVFAVTTAAGWSAYGASSVEYLFGKEKRKVYLVIFTALTVVGAWADVDIIWQLADLFNGLMAIPNIWALLNLHNEIRIKTTDVDYAGSE